MKKKFNNLLKSLAKQILAKYNPRIIGITETGNKTQTTVVLHDFLKHYTNVGLPIDAIDGKDTQLSVLLSVIRQTPGGKNPIRWAQVISKALTLIRTDQDYPEVLILKLGETINEDKDFMSLDAAIINEKANIIKVVKKDGIVLLNNDDPQLNGIKRKRKNSITYGFNESSNILCSEFSFKITLKKMVGNPDIPEIIPTAYFKITYRGSTVPFQVANIFTKNQVYAVLPSIAYGLTQNISFVDISTKLTSIPIAKGQLRFLAGRKDCLIIDDTYEACAETVTRSLESLATIKLKGIRKIAILGDLDHDDSDTGETYRTIGRMAVDNIDILLVVGKLMAQASETFKAHKKPSQRVFLFDNQNELIVFLKKNINSSDIILLKGGLAARMENVVKEIMTHPERASELLVRQ